MARAIDADRLLRVLESNFGNTGGASVMRQLIEMQPTLTPPNEWVSVEERLPTIEKDYGGYGSVSVNVFNGKSVLPMDYESSIVRGKKVSRWKYPWGGFMMENQLPTGCPCPHRLTAARRREKYDGKF